MSKTNRDKWKMTKESWQEWNKINKPKTVPSGKVYKRKPKYPAW